MGFGISSVGIPEISPYTKSVQPRIAGKHLTRHAKNGYAVVANIATLRSRASLLFEGRRPLPRSLDQGKHTFCSRFETASRKVPMVFCPEKTNFLLNI